MFFQHFSRTPTAKYQKKKKKKKKRFTYLPTLFFLEPLQETNNFFLGLILPVRKSEKKSLVTYLLSHQSGNTAGPLSERAEAMLRCRHCCSMLWLSAHNSANAHDAITLVCVDSVDTARCRGTL